MPSPIKYDRQQRFHWYLNVLKHRKSVKETCLIFGVSRKTYYKWYNRDYGKGNRNYTAIKSRPTKKHKLILAKNDLEEKISAFGRKSNNRFELAIAFLEDANQAEKYAQQENPERIRDFLEKIGSNFRLSGQKLFCDFKNPFKILAEAEPRQRRGSATIAQKSQSENWRCLFENIRTELAWPRLR